MQNKLKGTGVAMVTPFKEDKSIDYDALKKLTLHIINGKVDFLVVMGTTGENPVLSIQEQDDILSGYEELRSFKKKDLELMMPLRGLRIINYGAWIAKRWSDPSFPQLFPQYEDYTYWAEETEALERIAWSL